MTRRKQRATPNEVRRFVKLVGVALAVRVISTSPAWANDDYVCDARCEHVGDGCSCNPEEEAQAHSRCFKECKAEGRDASTAPSPPAPPTGECAETATMNECSACCQREHPAAFDAFEEDIRSCLCRPDVCGSECAASTCTSTGNVPEERCASCQTGSNAREACIAPANTRCRVDDECATMLACLAGGCRGKQ